MEPVDISVAYEAASRRGVDHDVVQRAVPGILDGDGQDVILIMAEVKAVSNVEMPPRKIRV